ncbi:MAG: electron transport complex subunit RsxG [Idiomarina sp.]
MTLSSMQKNGLILAAFAVAATLLIVGTSLLTEDQIKAQQQQQLRTNLNAVLPPETYTNNLFEECRLVTHQELGGNQPKHVYLAYQQQDFVGAAMEVTAPNGYSGAIQLLVAVYADGSVAGVRTLKHQETPGLGDKIERRKSDWIESFEGMQVNGADDSRWDVRKQGGVFDQFTGATITPRAVVHAVANAVQVFTENQSQWQQQPANCEEVASDARI